MRLSQRGLYSPCGARESKRMKRILEWLRIVRLVWTVDHDGDIRLRIVRSPKRRPLFGLPPSRHSESQWCAAILASNPVYLNDDGSTDGACYVSRWYPYNWRSPQPRAALAAQLDAVAEEWPEYIGGQWR